MFGPSGAPPSVTLLSSADQVTACHLLSLSADWLERGAALSMARAAWLYGLLTVLEKPIPADTCHDLRRVLRCSKAGSGPQLAVLEAVIGGVFHQSAWL